MASFHHTWCTGSCTCDFPSDPPGTSSPQHSTGRCSTHCPLFAPFPRLNQSLQGDWVLPWLASELQVVEEEEEEGWRVQVEAVLLGLLKKDMPLEVDFFGGGCSDCCWVLSCWLMMTWMSSWGKAGRGRKWAEVWGAGTLSSYHSNSLYTVQSSDCIGFKHCLVVNNEQLLWPFFVTAHWCCMHFSWQISIDVFLKGEVRRSNILCICYCQQIRWKYQN